jgi:hypothetical protein
LPSSSFSILPLEASPISAFVRSDYYCVGLETDFSKEIFIIFLEVEKHFLRYVFHSKLEIYFPKVIFYPALEKDFAKIYCPGQVMDF